MAISIDPSDETLEKLVADLLRTVPETWADFDPAALSASQEKAIYLLTAAGMIERRITFRVRMFGHPVAVEATITVTGECGFAEAIEPVIADIWTDWKEQFEKRKTGEQKDATAFHSERIGKEQWRLTVAGTVARRDLAEGNLSTVFDFVLKRGFFDDRPRLLPDGRISQRLPVAGNGKLERMQRISADAESRGVNITNWDAGAQAFAAEFAKLVNAYATQPSPPAADKGEGGTPSADPFADLRRFARVELKGQERAVIEALCDAGGELLITALAVKDGVGWDDPFQGFRNAQQRLNPKLKPLRWTLARQSNMAKLISLKS